MTASTHPDGSVTAIAVTWPNGAVEVEYGLTKRELFAAMAMQGLVTMFQTNMNCEDHIALLAVEQADALIEALNEGKETL